MEPTSIDIKEWAAKTSLTLAWEAGEGERRIRGWKGADGHRAIETNGNTIWSEASDLDRPFDVYWDAQSLSPSETLVRGSVKMADALAAWRAGNDSGTGYAPYRDEAGEDTIEEAVACAERDGWTLVLDHTNSDTIAVLRNGDGEWIGIGGDARGRGAWAVDITSAIRSPEKS